MHELMSQDIEEKMKFKRHAENLDMYKLERQLEISQSAAENIGNNGLSGAFVGINAANTMGQQLGTIVSEVFNTHNIQNELLVCDKCGEQIPVGTKFCKKCGDKLIVCPTCKKDNPSETKFCIFCGSPMKLVCSKCGTEYTTGAVFCGECGGKLNL